MTKIRKILGNIFPSLSDDFSVYTDAKHAEALRRAKALKAVIFGLCNNGGTTRKETRKDTISHLVGIVLQPVVDEALVTGGKVFAIFSLRADLANKLFSTKELLMAIAPSCYEIAEAAADINKLELKEIIRRAIEDYGRKQLDREENDRIYMRASAGPKLIREEEIPIIRPKDTEDCRSKKLVQETFPHAPSDRNGAGNS